MVPLDVLEEQRDPAVLVVRRPQVRPERVRAEEREGECLATEEVRVSGLSSTPTAFTNAREPSAQPTRVAQPGDMPPT